MKSIVKHLLAAGLILVVSLTVGALSFESYRILKYPNVVKHEVLDFNMGFLFLLAFVFSAGLLTGGWIWFQKDRTNSN